MSMAQIRKSYQVPAKRKGRVRFSGNIGKEPILGTVTGSQGSKLCVIFDGEIHRRLLHPTRELEYLPADQKGTESTAKATTVRKNVIKPGMLLHNHPKMEKQFNIPDNHVIIDKDLFEILQRIHGRYVTPAKAFVEPTHCIESTYRHRIETVMLLTDLTFDHPEIDDWSNPNDYSELFFTVPGGGIHGELPEKWMHELNGQDLSTCERMLTEHGYTLNSTRGENKCHPYPVC